MNTGEAIANDRSEGPPSNVQRHSAGSAQLRHERDGVTGMFRVLNPTTEGKLITLMLNDLYATGWLRDLSERLSRLLIDLKLPPQLLHKIKLKANDSKGGPACYSLGGSYRHPVTGEVRRRTIRLGPLCPEALLWLNDMLAPAAPAGESPSGDSP